MTRPRPRRRAALAGFVALLLGGAACTSAPLDGRAVPENPGGHGPARSANAAAGRASASSRPAVPTPAERAAASDWAKYFFPARPGHRCTLELVNGRQRIFGTTIETTGRTVQNVDAATPSSGGLDYEIASATRAESSATGAGQSAPTRTSDAQLLQYRLTPDGTVQAPQQRLTNGKLKVGFDGFVVFPPVGRLRGGGHLDTRINAAISSDDAATAALLRDATSDGSATLRMSITFRVSGFDPGVVTTPLATYRDVVGVRLALRSLTLGNAKIEGASSAAVDKVYRRLFPRTDVVWAAGVGPVAGSTKTLFGSFRNEVTGCNDSGHRGRRAAARPTVAGTPSSSSTPAASPSAPRRTVTVTGYGAGRTYRATILAGDRITDCAAHSYGEPLRAYFARYPCREAKRLLFTLPYRGRTVVMSTVAVVAQAGPEDDLYGPAERLVKLERADGTGSISDLVREGHPAPGAASRIPDDEAFTVQAQDSGVVVMDAWYADGDTVADDPDLVSIENDVFLTELAP